VLVPTNRLILWTALITLPFGVIAATIPHAVATSAVAIIGLFLFAGFDAFAGRSRLKGVEVRLPELVRMQKDREGMIELRIFAPSKRTLQLRVGLGLDEEFLSPEEGLTLIVQDNVSVSHCFWKTTPLKRGRYTLDGCSFETQSPMGFWSIRKHSPSNTEIRVYPNLLDERRNVSALFLARGREGMRTLRQSGRGREFEKLRDYIHGDSYDDIHWKASAKRGHLVTKLYQVERTQEVYVVLDTSRLTARSCENADIVLERFVTAALILALAAEQQGDLYGLVTFSNQVRTFLRARNGTAHYHACRDALYTVQPEIVTPDFEDLASFVRLRLRKRSLLIILTALDDPVLSESFSKSLELVCRQHLILINMIRPTGAVPVFSSDNVENLDDIYEHLGGHIRWQKLRELEKVLKRRGVNFNLMENERLAADLVSQYLNVKSRQLV
jgi:uncharacterized protein (DUF58 family)